MLKYELGLIISVSVMLFCNLQPLSIKPVRMFWCTLYSNGQMPYWSGIRRITEAWRQYGYHPARSGLQTLYYTTSTWSTLHL